MIKRKRNACDYFSNFPIFFFKFQVILGLLCPPYICQLEFKSKEELQSMPQTEEEHLTGLEEENDSVDGEFKPQTHRNTEPDSEVTSKNLAQFFYIFFL